MSSSTQIIFKVIRADSYDYWNDFIRSLIFTDNIDNRKELRFLGHRRPYTYRICESEESGFNFETVPTNKADPKRKSVWNQYLGLKQDENTLAISLESLRMELPDKKWNIKKSESQSELDFLNAKIRERNEALKWIKYQFTKHQSTSVTLIDNNNGRYIFRSPPFGHNGDRAELLVGVMLKADLCHIQRVMKYDGGTINRPFDKYSKKDMSRYLISKRNKYFESVSSLVESFGGDKPLRPNNIIKPLCHTEIMAALRFVPNKISHKVKHNINNFAIAVFSNNLESKLLAQLRHKSFIRLAKKKYPDLDDSQVPIVIYGENSLESYSLSDQEKDLNLVGSDKEKYKHYIDAIQFIIEDGNTRKLSESFSCEEFLKLVAAVDPDLDLKDCNSVKFIELSNGSTPLMIASRKGNVGDVKDLLEKGADLKLKDNYGYSALMKASLNGHKDVVETLLNQGASKDEKLEWCGWTVLMMACYYGHKNVVEYLLEQGADLEIKNKSGCNALTLAASKGHVDIVKCLITNRKNEDTSISEALWQAAKTGNLEMVNILLESEECKKNYITNYFKTFLSASLYNKEKISEALFNVDRESADNKEKVLFQLLKIFLMIFDITRNALYWVLSVFCVFPQLFFIKDCETNKIRNSEKI